MKSRRSSSRKCFPRRNSSGSTVTYLMNYNSLFLDFLQIFNLKGNNKYNEVDVKNAFRLLSREYEKAGMIKLDRVKEILAEMGLQDVEIL